MSRKTARNKLTASFCEKNTKPGRFNDGGSLYLLVKPDGRKTWTFRWRDRVTGKLREKGLGTYGERDVTLADARDLAADYRRIVKKGGDPIAQGRQEHARNVTFGWCADQYIKAHEPGWKNAKHADQWRNTLDKYAKRLKMLPVAAIDTPDVLACLKPIWETKTETATRVRGRIESVLGWATVSGYRDGDNPARWKKHLDNLLPKRSAVQKVKHFTALPYVRVGEFVERLRKDDRIQARALEFLILTACRVGELTSTPGSKGARWDEIDLQRKIWTIPADRMKAKKEHVIPLSPDAVTLLKALPQVTDFVFAGRGRDKALHSATLSQLTKTITGEMGADATVHGFRSTFRDWAGETTAYPREVIEHALAHQLKDKAEAAYQRGTLLEKRRRLMKDWAAYCDKPSGKAATVTPIRKKGKSNG